MPVKIWKNFENHDWALFLQRLCQARQDLQLSALDVDLDDRNSFETNFVENLIADTAWNEGHRLTFSAAHFERARKAGHFIITVVRIQSTHFVFVEKSQWNYLRLSEPIVFQKLFNKETARNLGFKPNVASRRIHRQNLYQCLPHVCADVYEGAIFPGKFASKYGHQVRFMVKCGRETICAIPAQPVLPGSELQGLPQLELDPPEVSSQCRKFHQNIIAARRDDVTLSQRLRRADRDGASSYARSIHAWLVHLLLLPLFFAGVFVVAGRTNKDAGAINISSVGAPAARPVESACWRWAWHSLEVTYNAPRLIPRATQSVCTARALCAGPGIAKANLELAFWENDGLIVIEELLMSDGNSPNWLAKLLLSLVALAVALLLGELVLWFLMPLPNPYLVPDTADQFVYDELRRAPRNRYVPSYNTQKVLELHPDLAILPGVSPKVKFTLNSFGFRNARMEHLRKPDGEIRVFAIGGSTTECLYLDDADAWPEVLQRKLLADAPGINVINAGHSGDTTRDHIAQLSQRVVPYRPDVVLFLAGINDLRLHLEPDYSPTRRDTNSLIPEENFSFNLGLKSWVVNISQISRLAILVHRGKLTQDSRGNPVQDPHGRWIQDARAQLQQMPLRAIDPDSVPKPEFEENLRTLVGVTRSAGAEPVFITQPVIWGAPAGEWEKRLWVSSHGRIPHAQLWKMLERFNEVTRRVSNELGVPLVDLALTLPKTSEVFYDDDHYTVAGAEKVAQQVALAFAKRTKLGIRIRAGTPRK